MQSLEKSTFEKLGVFYLGKAVDPTSHKVKEEELVLYESKNLTTHAVCVGMTGSGKTGLGIALLEEAGIDGIPAVIIDPKGDLANLLLTFPDLSPEEFLPWIDKEEAARQGLNPKEYAASQAKIWEKGLDAWGENKERIVKLRSSVDMAIYTPASRAGLPLSILSSFAAPPKEQMKDTDAIRDRILSLTSGVLGLLGVNADPIKSREHILIATLIEQAWSKGADIDLETLIHQIQNPPFTKIGALDIDTFFPAKERLALSINLNNLLASPGFQAWMEGDPLDMQQLLYTKKGKPKFAIISIAHLSDNERMFFVTLLLNELLSWMRKQTGTSSLRACLYMDEIFGFFPPTAMPSSKIPMLTLLKQARAFGVGIILATQNPVDLDYKGLANCGTWFIGKLQTERDKARVLEGLQIASKGDIEEKSLDKMLKALGNRIFILRSVHEKKLILFETRWTLSYLCGPITLAQISTLVDKSASPKQAPPSRTKQSTSPQNVKPIIPAGVPEFFVTAAKSDKPHYTPLLLGKAKLHFVDTKNKIDTWKDLSLLFPLNADGRGVKWDEGTPIVNERLESTPQPESTFDPLLGDFAESKKFGALEKAFLLALYQYQTLTIFYSPELKLTSQSEETEADFRAKVALQLREKRDGLTKTLRDKYEKKIVTLQDKMRKAQEKMDQKGQNATLQKAETAISFGTTLLGAVLGRKVTKKTLSDAGNSMRRIGKIKQESQAKSQAEEEYRAYQQQLNDVEAELNREIGGLSTSDLSQIKVESLTVRPRKSDIHVDTLGIAWLTYSRFS